MLYTCLPIHFSHSNFLQRVSLPHPHFKFCTPGFIFLNSHFKFYKKGFPFPIPHFNFVYRVSFSLFPILILCTGFPIRLSFMYFVYTSNLSLKFFTQGFFFLCLSLKVWGQEGFPLLILNKDELKRLFWLCCTLWNCLCPCLGSVVPIPGATILHFSIMIGSINQISRTNNIL